MIRRVSVALCALMLLSACGGGGGSPVTPGAPKAPSTTPGTVKFSLKIPGQATMARVRRPYYQSQATAGVAIDWTSATPASPDYAAPASSTCPGTLPVGVVSCSGNPASGTTYQFQLSIPAGTYPNFTVTTYDAAPTGTLPNAGSFTGANMLAQGQINGGITVTGGTANAIPSLTFYGIPATVSFVPAPSQPHVVAASSATLTNSYFVVGNQPQTFYAQAVDAGGFVISSNDTGAPSLSVVEGPNDACQTSVLAKACFTITQSNAYTYVLQAKSAAGTYASINVTATPGGSLQPASTLYTIDAAQEVWTTQSSGGSSPYGISGYPLYPAAQPTAQPPLQLSGALDYANPQLCAGQCNWTFAATDTSGNIWALAESYGVFEFKQGSGSPALVVPSAPVPSIVLGGDPQTMTIDGNGYLYLVDSNASTIAIYDTKSASVPLMTTISDPNPDATSIAIAPSTAGSIAGDIFVGDAAVITVFASYSGGATAPAKIGQISSGLGSAEALAFDPTGALWIYDQNDECIDVGTATTASFTPIAETAQAAYGSEQLGVTAQQVAYMGGAPSEVIGVEYYGLQGASFNNVGEVNPNANTWSVSIAP